MHERIVIREGYCIVGMLGCMRDAWEKRHQRKVCMRHRSADIMWTFRLERSVALLWCCDARVTWSSSSAWPSSYHCCWGWYLSSGILALYASSRWHSGLLSLPAAAGRRGQLTPIWANSRRASWAERALCTHQGQAGISHAQQYSMRCQRLRLVRDAGGGEEEAKRGEKMQSTSKGQGHPREEDAKKIVPVKKKST